MKITVTNLSNSPYKIGSQLLPARGKLEGVEVSQAELSQYRALGYFDISLDMPEAEPDPEPSLHDEYEMLSGESADGRWSEARLKKEIKKLRRSEASEE